MVISDQGTLVRMDGRRLVQWLTGLAYGIFSSSKNYIILSPPFVRRQIVFSKITKQFFSYQIRDRIDLAAARQIFSREDYNLLKLTRGRELLANYEAILKSGFSPLILDCGANIGASAKYFAENFPEALVVAVEPEIENFKLLTRNCVENNILPVHAGVAANDTKGDVFDPGLGNWGFRVSENNVGGIELKSIPTLLTRNECINRKPFLIKIDIEGFEENLFSANTGWIQEFPIMIIELHDWMLTNQANSRNFLKTISTYHRDFVYIGENVFSIAIADAIGVRHSDKSQ